ncbi:cytoglobin isoform X3 [Sus scrofa]|uniref:cytoglobin isoform X3 n=1 Tax=Sus scrofa TaxID=9823 RepID=UPI0006B2032B|nr:cytoglobin isoform X3 [Sus scrofa]
MEKAASPPGARAGPAEPPDLLRAGIPTPLGRGGPPGGSLERPGLPTFLPLTTLPQLAPAPFPVTAPPQERESRAPEKCWLQPGSYSSCAQLAGASPDLRVDGRQPPSHAALFGAVGPSLSSPVPGSTLSRRLSSEDPPPLGAKEAGGIPDSSSRKDATSASATVPLEPPGGGSGCGPQLGGAAGGLWGWGTLPP